MTLAVLKGAGTTPEESDRFKMWTRGDKILPIIFLSRWVLTSSWLYFDLMSVQYLIFQYNLSDKERRVRWLREKLLEVMVMSIDFGSLVRAYIYKIFIKQICYFIWPIYVVTIYIKGVRLFLLSSSLMTFHVDNILPSAFLSLFAKYNFLGKPYGTGDLISIFPIATYMWRGSVV